MTAKDYLRRYRELNDYINCKLDEVTQLRELATRLSPTAMFNNNGDISDRVGRTAAKIVDLEKEIETQIDNLVTVRAEIKRTIYQVDDERLRTILLKRYINGDKWEKIAVDLCIDLRWVYILHGRALQQIIIPQ